ncbi:MAG: hypothetical protein GY810_00970 [Aureispira sp.]|nr:hypothetical protein [Aureispira sp.]
MDTYLEISGRRTGKTSRLLKAFHAHKGEKYIVAHNLAGVSMFGVERRHIITPKMLREVVLKREILKGVKLFWDNFDFQREENSDLVKRGDYFVTTPRYTRTDKMFKAWVLGIREDIMIKLLFMTGNRYDKYVWDTHPGMDPQHEKEFHVKCHY